MKIAITTRLDKVPSYDETRISLDVEWFELLSLISNQISVIPINQKVNTSLYENSDLIIFSGGNNLKSVCDNTLSSLRDKIEKDILSYAIRKKIPTVGVCRGMQLINEFMGGTLVPISNHINECHPLEINAGWIPNIPMVNSYHEWGISSESLASKLEACAFSDNKSFIEAFSHTTLPIRGVMWHPERLPSFLDDRACYYLNQLSLFDFQ